MRRVESIGLVVVALFVALVLATSSVSAQERKPNIIVIMGDDIGWFNLGAYNGGIMLNATPNLDKLATEGMRLTDYYAEASCTAGRANFITGELPIRTGLTTVGQAGSALGYPDAAPSIADALKSMGYATGQFGKNHLGDRNPTLPCLHGFDEYFGYLYHLNAMEDLFYYTYPPEWKGTTGPRNLVHCWATNSADPTSQPRWGVIGKQKIVDEGPLPPEPVNGIKYNMGTFDEAITASTIGFMDKAKKDGKPFFIWMNPTRACADSPFAKVRRHAHSGDRFWPGRSGIEADGRQHRRCAQLA